MFRSHSAARRRWAPCWPPTVSFAGLAVSSSLPVVLDSTRLQSRAVRCGPASSLTHLGHPTARRHHPSLESDRSSIGDLLDARAAAAVTDLARVTLTGSRPVDLIHPPSGCWPTAFLYCFVLLRRR